MPSFFQASIENLLGAAALGAMSMTVHAAAVPGQGTWETTLEARDINGDSVVDAYYDTALDITWLADWNVNGKQNWDAANAWATGLDVYGVTGWRLPSTINALSSRGYKPPVDSSELAHLYYVTLGNKGYTDPGYGLSNTANFINMQSAPGFGIAEYWSETPYVIDDPRRGYWYFGLYYGQQSGLLAVESDYAVAVHAGDVPHAIPEPQTYALMLAGLAGLLAVRRRQR